MHGEVMDILIGRGCLLDPFMRAHIAHAMKMCAIFNRDRWRADVSNEHPRLKNLNFVSGRDGAVNLPAGHQGPCGNDALDHRIFTHDQRSRRMNLTFKPTVDAHSTIKVDDALEIYAFSQKSKIFTVTVLLSFFISHGPHSCLLEICGLCNNGIADFSA